MNLSINSSHYFENDLTNGLIDVRLIALSTAKLMLLAGAGAIIWGHGSTPGVQVQGGPDVGFYFRDWKLRMDIQGGYGSDNEYGHRGVFPEFRLGRLTVQADGPPLAAIDDNRRSAPIIRRRAKTDG